MEYLQILNNNLILAVLLIYACSIMYYQYFFAKEIQSVNNLLELTWIEVLKILFLALVGILPIANTFMCMGIAIYHYKKYRESKSNKYE